MALPISSGDPIVWQVKDRSIRLIIPDNAFPAPISQISVTPSAAKNKIDSRHRTEPVTCYTSSDLMVDGSLTAVAFTLEIKGKTGIAISTSSSATFILTAAGSINLQ